MWRMCILTDAESVSTHEPSKQIAPTQREAACGRVQLLVGIDSHRHRAKALQVNVAPPSTNPWRVKLLGQVIFSIQPKHNGESIAKVTANTHSVVRISTPRYSLILVVEPPLVSRIFFCLYDATGRLPTSLASSGNHPCFGRWKRLQQESLNMEQSATDALFQTKCSAPLGSQQWMTIT